MKPARWFLALALFLIAARAGWTCYREAAAGAAMTDAATAFVAALDDEQKQAVLLDYDSPRRVDWHFIPKEERKGLQVRHMTDPQRKAALDLLRSALSQVGYDKATKIMELEGLLNELEMGKGRFLRDPTRYYFTVFGKPSAESRWGLSVEGHHLSLNFVIDSGRVVASTPQVFCSNPATVKSDNKVNIAVGTRLLKDEEQVAFDLVNSLTGEQRGRAVIDAKAPAEVRAAGEPQPPQDPPVGLPASELTADQKEQLRSLIEVYTSAMVDQVADDRLAAIDAAGMDGVHFAWAGPTEPGIGHYYRIQGPTFVVEFVNTQPDAAGNPANHIHTVWRDIRGDFGLPAK
jgi:hypothetical protein